MWGRGVEPSADSLGAVVAARRRHLGLGQLEVAELADVSERFVREVEHDKPTIRLDKLRAVLAVLGLELRPQVRGVPR